VVATPPAEVTVTPELARRLLLDQHPDLAELALEPAAEGWDNVMFRLGPGRALRLPRRVEGGRLIEVEQQWLPRVAEVVPIAVPTPERVGAPGAGYPWAWSVVPWIDGDTAERSPPATSEAPRFGAFLRALHGLLPAGAPRNPFREPPLAAHGERFEERVRQLRGARSAAAAPILSAWRELAGVEGPGDLTLIHGDLHPRNVIVSEGRIAGVIDWGDLTAGDPATDLAATWFLFAVDGHEALCAAYGSTDTDLWARARGWALYFAVLLLTIDDDPRHQAAGAQALERILAG